MKSVLDALLSVVLAAPCCACEEPLEAPTGGPMCPKCWASIGPLTPPLCDVCGDPLPSWRTFSTPLALCPRCRRRTRFIDRARAAGRYEGALRAAVQALKYDGRRSLARPLARLMRDRADAVLAGADLVVPVPLHPFRRLERGFNQAADLARHLDLRVEPVLRRNRATAIQADLPAARRHANVRGAFDVVARPDRLRGLTIVLVDDVSTTGATLDACARVLKRGGAREVRALTAARAVLTSG